MDALNQYFTLEDEIYSRMRIAVLKRITIRIHAIPTYHRLIRYFTSPRGTHPRLQLLHAVVIPSTTQLTEHGSIRTCPSRLPFNATSLTLRSQHNLTEHGSIRTCPSRLPFPHRYYTPDMTDATQNMSTGHYMSTTPRRDGRSQTRLNHANATTYRKRRSQRKIMQLIFALRRNNAKRNMNV